LQNKTHDDTRAIRVRGSGISDCPAYLIVGDANPTIDHYRHAFDALEIEHDTPGGRVGHAKLRTIAEIGEHPKATGGTAPAIPSVGLRLYVTDIDQGSRSGTCRREGRRATGQQTPG
jgi:hypothetical protein